MSRLRQLHDAGVSIWLDTLSRDLLSSGRFAELIAGSAVTGATSNPTIFAKAIADSDLYDDQLAAVAAAGVRDLRELFFAVALEDIRRAADLLRPAYDASGGRDGFVSFECTPDVADDTAATVEQALELWARIARPNAMIKVPATDAGLPAIEALTARGVNVNVTLLFSVDRYEQVIDAYLAGLERRIHAGEPVGAIASVASFFVSRIDAKADAVLPADSPLRGRVAIANAHRAYARYRARFTDRRWLALERAGAHPQRPLWASTGTKDPAYSDVLYVEQLIAPGVINTMPEATLSAFADHGTVGAEIDRRRRTRRRRRCARRAKPASTSTRSRASSSVPGSARSATPIASCSPASRPCCSGSPRAGSQAQRPEGHSRPSSRKRRSSAVVGRGDDHGRPVALVQNRPRHAAKQDRAKTCQSARAHDDRRGLDPVGFTEDRLRNGAGGRDRERLGAEASSPRDADAFVGDRADSVGGCPIDLNEVGHAVECSCPRFATQEQSPSRRRPRGHRGPGTAQPLARSRSERPRTRRTRAAAIRWRSASVPLGPRHM